MNAVETIRENRVIAVLRGFSPSEVENVTEQLIRGGVRLIEVTMDSPQPFRSMKKIREKHNEVLIGAGTVLDPNDVERLEEAGAAFAVSPVFDPDVVETLKSKEITPIPGCLTPTEMMSAYRQGVKMVKLFPASSMGPGYLKSVKGPLPDDLSFVPTGGIDDGNAGAFMKAGATAVGAGSFLTDGGAIERDGYQAVRERAKALMEAVRDE